MKTDNTTRLAVGMYDAVMHTCNDQNVECDCGAVSTGVKHDAGKPRMDLIPPDVEKALGIVLEYGSREYEDRNWEQGMDWGRLYAAAKRHLGAYWSGEDFDAESGLPHIDHALCCIVFLSAYRMRNVGQDTRNRITSSKAEE